MINSYKLEPVTITPYVSGDGEGGQTFGTPYTHSFFIDRKLIYEKRNDNIEFLIGNAILKTSNDLTLNDKDKITFDSTEFRIAKIMRPRSWGYSILEIMVI
jgi:hypothetical protein